MTPRQICLIKESFAAMGGEAERAAAHFYARLFESQPRLRALFAEDLSAQRRRLMEMISVAVTHLDQAEALLPVLRDLGRRHAAYGVREEDYAPVGSALLATLEELLGPRFNTEVRQAWAVAYGVLSAAMRSGLDERGVDTPVAA